MGSKTSWLTLFALSSEYERVARLTPALVSILPLLPLTFALGGGLVDWQTALGGTAGVFALGAWTLANLASAFGNRIQKQLWPDWPFDAPTHVRLMPDNADTSPQQRARWYDQVKELTGLDLAAEACHGDHTTVRATVNDAVERLRNRFRRGHSQARHDQESIRYGGVRNLTGMRAVWLSLSLVSCIGTWLAYVYGTSDIVWSLIASALPAPLFWIAFYVLPSFVRTRARYYCEVFFRLLEEETA